MATCGLGVPTARLAPAQEIDAIASGPASKQAMHAVAAHHPGQTDIVAEGCRTPDCLTVLAGGPSKVFLLSLLVSRRQAIDLVRCDRAHRIIGIADRAPRALWRIDHPRIAAAGLRPRAGDGAVFGREEIRGGDACDRSPVC